MGQFNTSGAFPAALQPTQTKTLYQNNYLDFFDLGAGGQWAQQFLPDVYEKETERYGNRSISSFLRMVSAEMPSTADQIIWTEQGRLHTRYVNATTTAVTDAGNRTFTVPGTQPTTLNRHTGAGNGDITAVNFRVGQTVMIQENGTDNRGVSGAAVGKGVVTAVSGLTFDVTFYGTFVTATGTTYTALVYGSEFAKGTGNFTDKLDAEYSTFQNSPIILKEHYGINGSDASQIGWIEVTSENGASGYLWYMKSEHENRLRFEDYIEMSMVEGVAGDINFDPASTTGIGQYSQGASFANQSNDGANRARLKGTQGFFSALEDRANVYQGFGDEAAGGGALTDFDNVLKQLDKQGSIEENMIFVNRDLALELDDILSQQNSYGAGGTSWGVFNNSEDMALTLGFSGFRRGSYDFYKTDWKYLNDWSTRGGFSDIEGVLVPAGTSTVYDQNLGKNIKRPFLHVRYRSSEADNRKMKSWITGSVGGAYTTDIDEMRIHYLTERCLITQAANNFVLFRS